MLVGGPVVGLLYRFGCIFQLKAWRKQLRESVQAMDKRCFVIMTAQTKGWSFAKELDFYQSGEKSDKNYDKVAKRQAKRAEDIDRDAKKTKRKSEYRPYGFQGRYASYQAPAAQAWGPPPAPVGPYQVPPPAVTVKPPMDKARMRCNNCRELGHFFRECTKPSVFTK